jgi:hypothetical protein
MVYSNRDNKTGGYMKTRLALMLLFFILALPSISLAEKGFKTPDISKATLTLEENQIISGAKHPTVINIRTYKNSDGTLFRAYSVGGNIFRYDVDINGAPPYEYRLLDKDGDGIFETKEDLVGEMLVQEKGEKYFIDLGPEPGKEYKYSYEDIKRPGIVEQKQLLMGYPIYIPPWVLLRFDIP